jgi:hypothetical protein
LSNSFKACELEQNLKVLERSELLNSTGIDVIEIRENIFLISWISMNKNEKEYFDKVKTYILEMEDGWGDNDENKKFSANFVNIVVRKVEKMINSIRKSGKDIPTPTISPMDYQSLDIYFKNEKIRMLINIPESEDEYNHSSVYAIANDLCPEMKVDGDMDIVMELSEKWILAQEL